VRRDWVRADHVRRGWVTTTESAWRTDNGVLPEAVERLTDQAGDLHLGDADPLTDLLRDMAGASVRT
jgi:hypothetical protein